jgi:hypothetical protein
VNRADWPGLIIIGVASPEVPNSIALDANCVIVTVSFPVLVSVAICVAFCPTGTDPKLMSDGEIWTASCGVRFVFEVFASPAQPLKIATPLVNIANIAAAPRPRLFITLNSLAPFSFAAFPLAISSPPDPFVP